MTVSETWSAWDPLPAEFNRYMLLNVMHLETAPLGSGERGKTLSVLIASSALSRAEKRLSSSESDRSGLWRLSFHFVQAFRATPDEFWRGARPKARPTDMLERATWEILDSQWLSACTDQQTRRSSPLHHFVIASSYDFYDIAATTWDVQRLDNEDAVLDHLRARWRQEHEAPAKGEA